MEILIFGLILLISIYSTGAVSFTCGRTHQMNKDEELTLNGYEKFMNCTFTVSIARGRGILVVVKHFHTESTHDTLSIASAQGVIDTWSGFKSEDNALLCLGLVCTFRFKSDAGVEKDGFALLLSYMDDNNRDCRTSVFAEPSPQSLVVKRYRSRGMEKICYLFIWTSSGSQIFLDGSISKSSRLLDGATLSTSIIPNYGYLSKSSSVLVWYRSRGWGVISSFRVNYQASGVDTIIRSCSSYHIYNPGEIAVVHSPNYPSDYGNYEDCLYEFASSRSNVVFQVTLLYLNTEQYDKVIIYNGPVSNDIELIQWYGDKEDFRSLLTTTSTCNTMNIKFTSDSSITDTGFKLLVKAKQVDTNTETCPTSNSESHSEGFNLRTLGIVVGALSASLACCGFCYRCCCKTKKRRVPTEDEAAAVELHAQTEPAPATAAETVQPLMPTAPVSNTTSGTDPTAPPSYDDVMLNSNTYAKSSVDVLPTYEEYRMSNSRLNEA